MLFAELIPIVRAGARRCVRVFDVEPGLARLTADLPTAYAHGIHDRLTEQARLLQQLDDTESPTESGAGRTAETGPRDGRTLDQIRADILTDLLLTGIPVATAARTSTGNSSVWSAGGSPSRSPPRHRPRRAPAARSSPDTARSRFEPGGPPDRPAREPSEYGEDPGF